VEPVVELQAVQGPRPVVEAEHVVGDEVAVAVDDAAVGAAVGEQRLPSIQEPARRPVHGVDEVDREYRARPALR
jgi:hypothetical protein